MRPVSTSQREESPLSVGRRDWKGVLRDLGDELQEDRIPLTAAGVALYWFLATFPALIAFVGVLGLLDLSSTARQTIIEAIRTTLPGGAARVLTDVLRNTAQTSGASSVFALVTGLAVAVWGASSGMVAVQKGLDVAYDVPESRKFAKARLVALGLVGATFVLAGLGMALLVFGQPLGELVNNWLPLGSAFVPVWTAVRWSITLVLIAVLFGLFYSVAPNRPRPEWKWITPGGILATGTWLVASLGFSFYVSSFGSYAETYGSLAGVVVLVLWLFLSALALLVGGELNAVLERHRTTASR